MKLCQSCKKYKKATSYHKNKRKKDGLDPRCKTCRKIISRASYLKSPFTTLIRCKRSDCKKKAVLFDLTSEYLRKIWTGICPITGKSITVGNEGSGSHRSAHLDRIVPSRGYIEGNVAFIDSRANRIKYDATVAELRQIADWLESEIERATTIPNGSTPK